MRRKLTIIPLSVRTRLRELSNRRPRQLINSRIFFVSCNESRSNKTTKTENRTAVIEKENDNWIDGKYGISR